jgi:2-dehydropantoate 2-reductase
MDTADFIIIATKVTNPEKDAPQLLGLMKPILGPSTVVLFLQNGINMEERISKHISNPILGGLAFTCINRLKPNLIHHIDYGLIKIGALRKKENSIAKEIVEVFLQSGIETIHAPDLRQARYEKLLWNVPFNSLSVLCATDTEQLIANPETKELARKLMEETRSIAKKEGKKITGKMIDEMIKKTESMKPYKTSMLIDFESKKKMEVESILGELIRLAKEYKIPVPYLETIYKLLSFYNAKI